MRVEVGDTFDEAGLAEMIPGPSVAVILGLFELFPENERVMRTLRGFRRACATGGGRRVSGLYGAAVASQLEMIVRVLVGFDASRGRCGGGRSGNSTGWCGRLDLRRLSSG